MHISSVQAVHCPHSQLHFFSLLSQTQPPDPELQSALGSYGAHLDSAERVLRERERQAESRLRKYEGAGEKAMKEIARRKREIEREIEAIQGEIKQLEEKKK